jgi:23S rRNA pseudouridine1911/1915/1917 synthase
MDETEHFAVVYKPPFLHSAPLKKDSVPTGAGGEERGYGSLLGWYARTFPGIRRVRGRNEWEGGILHRLDFETWGLVLFAKTQFAMDALLVQQDQGSFVKEYGALSLVERRDRLPGFPTGIFFEDACPCLSTGGSLPPAPFSVESAFRPYGPGRKAVRPSVDRRPPFQEGPVCGARGPLQTGAGRRLYQTEILEWEAEGKRIRFRLRLKRGFRHQIRCHLAWLGFPLLNDALYGGPLESRAGDARPLALKADMLAFYDPASSERRVYRLES